MSASSTCMQRLGRLGGLARRRSLPRPADTVTLASRAASSATTVGSLEVARQPALLSRGRPPLHCRRPGASSDRPSAAATIGHPDRKITVGEGVPATRATNARTGGHRAERGGPVDRWHRRCSGRPPGWHRRRVRPCRRENSGTSDRRRCRWSSKKQRQPGAGDAVAPDQIDGASDEPIARRPWKPLCGVLISLTNVLPRSCRPFGLRMPGAAMQHAWQSALRRVQPVLRRPVRVGHHRVLGGARRGAQHRHPAARTDRGGTVGAVHARRHPGRAATLRQMSQAFGVPGSSAIGSVLIVNRAGHRPRRGEALR